MGTEKIKVYIDLRILFVHEIYQNKQTNSFGIGSNNESEYHSTIPFLRRELSPDNHIQQLQLKRTKQGQKNEYTRITPSNSTQ